MDIRLMQYYLAVVREGTISAAAEALHVSQSALSRQIKDLEEELGVTLFTRGSRRITLTEEGMILRRRAEEMLQLMQLTEAELTQTRDTVTGEIRIGAGESHAFHFLSRAAGRLMREHPGVRVHVVSGDTADLMDQLGNGLLDFALIFSEFDRTLYHSLVLPQEDRFGVLIRRDSALAQKDTVTLDDLIGKPLLISRAADGQQWTGEKTQSMNVVGTYNLIYNASLMVEDGLGYALCFDRLINVSGDSVLCFRPLTPEVTVQGTLIWKRYQVLSPAVRLFVEQLAV